MFPHPTPAFVVDAAALERNLAILGEVKRRTGCRILLALKAFSMFSVFPRMRRVMDGCCASSVHERASPARPSAARSTLSPPLSLKPKCARS